MADPIRKNATAEWTWFADYALAYAEWTVTCPADRACQVGMGVKAFGVPLGEKIGFNGSKQFTTLGVGAINVRVTDGKGACPVQLDQGKVGPINLVDQPF